MGSTTGPSNDMSIFNEACSDGLLQRQFFIAPSLEIFSGFTSLFNYGPPGCAVPNYLIATWKQHFIVEEGLLELEASCVTHVQGQ